MSSSLAFPADNSFLSMKPGHPDLRKPVASGWVVFSHDTENEKGRRLGRGREGEELKDVFPIQRFLHFSFLFILGTFQLCLHGSQLVDIHMHELCMNVYMLSCVCMHACAGRSQRLMSDVFPNFWVRVSRYPNLVSLAGLESRAGIAGTCTLLLPGCRVKFLCFLSSILLTELPPKPHLFSFLIYGYGKYIDNQILSLYSNVLINQSHGKTPWKLHR